MPKLKTKKSVAKRFGVTANGKLKRTKPGRRHLLAKKSRKRKRQLRQSSLVDDSKIKTYFRMIGK